VLKKDGGQMTDTWPKNVKQENKLSNIQLIPLLGTFGRWVLWWVSYTPFGVIFCLPILY
jgi:hypothetical protein